MWSLFSVEPMPASLQTQKLLSLRFWVYPKTPLGYTQNILGVLCSRVRMEGGPNSKMWVVRSIRLLEPLPGFVARFVEKSKLRILRFWVYPKYTLWVYPKYFGCFSISRSQGERDERENVSGAIGLLSRISARYRCSFGRKVKSGWTRSNGGFGYTQNIPFGCFWVFLRKGRSFRRDRQNGIWVVRSVGNAAITCAKVSKVSKSLLGLPFL